jgi:hypothetical protein
MNSGRTVSVAGYSKRSQAARERALHVLALMRHDPKQSLTSAAKLEGVKPGTVKRYFSSALKKRKGKFRATKSDRYTVTLYVPDVHGSPVAVKTHSSRERTQLGQYLRDLGRYLRGDANALAAWHGKRVAGVELVTAGRTIEALEPVLSDFSLYKTLNGGAA